MTTAYPLSWPPSIPRCARREKGAFKTSLAGALKNVQESLQRFGKDSGKQLNGIVLSSNCSLGVEKPADPGVAVWFTWDTQQFCIPVDRYDTPAANLQAIHHIIEARRVELRHGTLALVRATFAGFRALPGPSGKRTWREVFGVAGDRQQSLDEITRRYRELASKHHPDRAGGSHEAMSELNAAYEEAKREIT